jgi:hypothetical protein
MAIDLRVHRPKMCKRVAMKRIASEMIRLVAKPHVILSFAVCICSAAGCGVKDDVLEFAPVEGTLKIKGEPAANVMVNFMPDKSSGPNCPTSSGITDEEGKFTLATTDGRDGAVVGTGRVTLIDMNNPPRPGEEAGGEPFQPRKYPIPPSATIPSANGLSMKVSDGGVPVEINVP